jgi:hypothetical protein
VRPVSRSCRSELVKRNLADPLRRLRNRRRGSALGAAEGLPHESIAFTCRDAGSGLSKLPENDIHPSMASVSQTKCRLAEARPEPDMRWFPNASRSRTPSGSSQLAQSGTHSDWYQPNQISRMTVHKGFWVCRIGSVPSAITEAHYSRWPTRHWSSTTDVNSAAMCGFTRSQPPMVRQ